ncbi:ATP-binding cassette domain-containing protein [Streptomyces sp. NPDC049585]|uniref:ATP-binding cassette domain-containing protein n=1 Tax=Streptomyces sp. NPDC049585 TaxID=3155154 RepID=UPI0034440796
MSSSTAPDGTMGTAAAIAARGLGVKGPRGWVFRSVDISAPPGSLVAVAGPSGSGRTCLLLTLTGRMRPSAGHAEVAGLPLPRRMAAVRRVSALAHVPGVAELDASLTVAEHLREGALLQQRFGSLRGLLRPRAGRAAAAAARREAALAAVGLDVEALPKGARTVVRDLGRLQALRLSLAVALLGGPRLLAVDDTDLKLSPAERQAVWALLRSLAARGDVTVLAVCSEAPEGAVVVRTDAGSTDAGNSDVDSTIATTATATTSTTKGEADALAEAGRP